MKKFYSLVSIFFIITINAQVGIGTINPEPDSALEISSIDKAILITKIELVDTSLPTPLLNHVGGMIVYNTNTNGSGNTSVSPGIYYNNGVRWIKLEPISINIGDIKHGIATSDHLGWYKLDGRPTNTLPSLAQQNAGNLGFTTNLPDATDKILKGKTISESLSQTGGNNNIILTQSNLPNVIFTGSTSNDGNHTHNYTDKHNSRVEDINLVYGLLGILSGIGLNILNTNIGNKTPTTITTNSSNSGNHSHTVTVNSGGNDTPLQQIKSIKMNTFIYLGE